MCTILVVVQMPFGAITQSNFENMSLAGIWDWGCVSDCGRDSDRDRLRGCFRGRGRDRDRDRDRGCSCGCGCSCRWEVPWYR